MEKYSYNLKTSKGENLLFPVRNQSFNIDYQEGKVLGFGRTADDLFYVETTVGNHTKKYVIQSGGYIEEVGENSKGKVEEVVPSNRGKIEEVGKSKAGKIEEVEDRLVGKVEEI
ncbi:hypothetical protein [Bacillus pinisoli]|uniref:hypothetical protein n=1 Tax=Bacillus pinisoli TaxID=2901866 RepID=UPI001FF507A0|nr:hypothetical protein [Bacillus pinisoli]